MMELIEVEGYLAATLGHGVTEVGEGNDIRAHAFFGNYEKVLESLKRLSERDGVFEFEGVKRDKDSGLVSGFLGCTSEH
jgi:Hint-domain